MATTYDVVVIGSGPGGYVCAIKCSQLGLKVAIVEKNPTFGGTCLNVGCIPSKALLHTSEMFSQAGHEFKEFGIDISKPKLNLKAMMAHKDETIKANVDGVAYLLKKNKIDTFIGTGSIKSPTQVLVMDDKGKTQEVDAKNIVIATGSDASGIPGLNVEIDEKTIITSTGALSLPKVPKSMLVIGGGVIGLELGSVWSRLGSDVTVIEYMDCILNGTDKETSKNLVKLLEQQGLKFKLSSKVTGVEKKGNGASVTFEPVEGGENTSLEADIVLIATGRHPYTDGLGLEDAGVEMDGAKVKTNHWRTNIESIWAIGDVTAGPMLAHKAEDEGIAVAETIAGQAGHVNYNTIPGVIYTSPELAVVGRSEEQLKDEGVDYVVGKFPFIANGRARAMNATSGFVKFLADKNTDQILGSQILGSGASEMIHEIVVLMDFGGSSEDLSRVCHAHPTMSEAIREAALATHAKPLHI